MRIDRSDLADKPDDAPMASRRARSTPDDPDAAAKDHGNAGASDGPPDSSAAPPDSALRIGTGRGLPRSESGEVPSGQAASRPG